MNTNQRTYTLKKVLKDGVLLPLEERTFITNEGYSLTIIDGGTKLKHLTCQIGDYTFEATFDNIKKGQVKNPFHPSIQKIGYLGVGQFKAHDTNRVPTKAYHKWHSMINRCYNPKVIKRNPTYENVSVCSEWHNFQNFAKWFEKNYIPDCELDKDLLSKDTLVYSSSTCVFLPCEINNYISTNYKTNTTGYIGVSLIEEGKWFSCVRIKGKNKHLGSFTDISKAKDAYIKAKIEGLQNLILKYSSVLTEKSKEALLKWVP